MNHSCKPCPLAFCLALQSIHLLPHALEPDAVARFLRFCPGLAKASIGEVLGERDLFYEQVRQAFIETFLFRGGRMCVW
jgi:brefeldin A-resistance guanine nucleotide exchange factor 1